MPLLLVPSRASRSEQAERVVAQKLERCEQVHAIEVSGLRARHQLELELLRDVLGEEVASQTAVARRQAVVHKMEKDKLAGERKLLKLEPELPDNDHAFSRAAFRCATNQQLGFPTQHHTARSYATMGQLGAIHLGRGTPT